MQPERQATTSARLWASAHDGVLELQRCAACARLRFFPAGICPHCLAVGGEWEVLSGRATVYAYTVVHRAPSACFAADVPYIIALAELSEGPRILARVQADAGRNLAVGDSLVFVGGREGGEGSYLLFASAGQGHRS